MFCQEWEYNKIVLDEETNKHISQAVIMFLSEVLNLVKKTKTKQETKNILSNMSQISLLVSKQIF